MTYRTLAHALHGTSDLKVWVVTAKPVAAPRTFITQEWIRAVYLSDNPPTTFTKRRVQPENFELNEPGDWETTKALQGQAMYRTDHGFYLYEWDDSKDLWEKVEIPDDFDPGPMPERT